jgi:hypothetical protein
MKLSVLQSEQREISLSKVDQNFLDSAHSIHTYKDSDQTLSFCLSDLVDMEQVVDESLSVLRTSVTTHHQHSRLQHQTLFLGGVLRQRYLCYYKFEVVNRPIGLRVVRISLLDSVTSLKYQYMTGLCETTA